MAHAPDNDSVVSATGVVFSTEELVDDDTLRVGDTAVVTLSNGHVASPHRRLSDASDPSPAHSHGHHMSLNGILRGANPRFRASTTTSSAAPSATSPSALRAKRMQLRRSQTTDSSVTVMVAHEPIVLTNLVQIIHTWGTRFKQHQKAHEAASVHFGTLHRKYMLSYHIISVVLGCSAVAETTQRLVQAGNEGNRMALVVAMTMASLLFWLSFVNNCHFVVMEKYWRFESLAQAHEQRGRLHGQLALQCERTLGSLRLKRGTQDEPLHAYMMLMTARNSMLEHNPILPLPSHLTLEEPLGGGTPMFIPLNTPAVWATPDEQPLPSATRDTFTRRANPHRHHHTMRLKTLVRHVQTMAQCSPEHDLERPCAPPMRFDSRVSSPHFDSKGDGGNSTTESLFTSSLQAWQTQALGQADSLQARATQLQRKSRVWNICRGLPLVVMQVTTSVNVVQQLQALGSDSSAAGWAVSVLVLIILLFQKAFEHLHAIFAFKQRAIDADAHMRRLQGFSEHISSVLINQETVPRHSPEMDTYMRHHLEELRRAREDIREHFSMHKR